MRPQPGMGCPRRSRQHPFIADIRTWWRFAPKPSNSIPAVSKVRTIAFISRFFPAQAGTDGGENCLPVPGICLSRSEGNRLALDRRSHRSLPATSQSGMRSSRQFTLEQSLGNRRQTGNRASSCSSSTMPLKTIFVQLVNQSTQIWIPFQA